MKVRCMWGQKKLTSLLFLAQWELLLLTRLGCARYLIAFSAVFGVRTQRYSGQAVEDRTAPFLAMGAEC
jgi:hypothetical protein